MGKVSEYAFINAKLRARIGEINSSTLLSDMVKAPTLNEAISTLKNTRYSRLVSVYAETGDLQAVELAFPGRKVTKVRTVYVPSHAKRVGYTMGRTQSGKKAIVTIEGEPLNELIGA